MPSRQYRKRPVVVEALQLTSTSYADVLAFLAEQGGQRNVDFAGNDSTHRVSIRNPSGMLIANPGDWIVRGTAGEYYPVLADIFPTIYERVNGEAKPLAKLKAKFVPLSAKRQAAKRKV